MKLYRNITIKELKTALETGLVYPKEFKGNSDSTIESGNWSFWFKNPVDLHGGYIVEADFEPTKVGTMSFHQENYNGDMVKFEIDEFVADFTVEIEKIYVENCLDYDFPEFIETFNDILTGNCNMSGQDLGYFDQDEDWGISPESMVKIKNRKNVEVFTSMDFFKNMINFAREVL